MNQSVESIITRTADAYDSTPYESLPFDFTQPEHMSALAYLMGIVPVPLARARVLEIGCASGGNLLPFAVKHPEAVCVGVDISTRQIDDGKAFLQRFGINNVTLLAADICEAGPSLGEFDYIICHGVFSWVPSEVQVGILQACKSLLSENGVAYISYNVFPGWHCWELGRHLMYRASAHIEDPKERLSTAIEALKIFSEQACDSPDRPIRQMLKEGLKRIEDQPWYYVLHEYLEPCNTPLYFRDFIAALSGHGLRYLADVQFSSMFRENAATGAVGEFIANNAKHRYDEEEMLDYITGRTFRRSLIVHDHRQVSLAVTPQRLNALTVLSNFTRKKSKKAQDGTNNTFVKHSDSAVQLKIQDPLGIAVLDLLDAHYPHPVEMSTLLFEYWSATGVNIQTKTDADILSGLETLSSFVLSLLQKDVVQISCHDKKAVKTVSEHPVAFPLARFQAANANVWVTNVYAQVVPLEGEMQQLLPLLDGSISVADLARKSSKWLTESGMDKDAIQARLQKNLERMSATSLLVF